MLNKKQKEKSKIISNLQSEIERNNLVIYKGFIIKKSIDVKFNNTYYTIINKHTMSHVHAQNLDNAKKICDAAYILLRQGYLNPNMNISIQNRAAKLAYRKSEGSVF